MLLARAFTEAYIKCVEVIESRRSMSNVKDICLNMALQPGPEKIQQETASAYIQALTIVDEISNEIFRLQI